LKKLLLLFSVLLLSCGGGGGGGGGETGPVDVPPVAEFIGTPTIGSVPLNVQFSSLSTGTITSYRWDFNNDGTIDGNSYSMAHQYTESGIYSVSLTVEGPAGIDSITKTNYITVNAVPPVAGFVATPTSGTTDLRVQFTNNSTGYNQSTWDFGDGNTSNDDNPMHTYTTAGTYNVALNVSGEAGTDSETKTGYINVTGLTTPALIVDPKYTDTSNGSTVTLNLKVIGVTGLAAAQARLTFDPSKLTIGDVTSGNFLTGNSDPLFIVTPEDNAVTIYTSSLSSDKPSVDGDGVIANINFTTTTPGIISVDLDNSSVIFLDVDGNNLSVNGLENGYLYVN